MVKLHINGVPRKVGLNTGILHVNMLRISDAVYCTCNVVACTGLGKPT